MYLHEPFPSVRYHRSGKTQLVQSADHHDELMASDPDNWAETPAYFEDDAPAASDDAEGEPSEPAAAPAAPKKRKAK